MTEPTDDPAAPGDGGPEPGVAGSEPGDIPGSTPLNRRRFIGWAAAGGVAAAAVAFGLSDSGDQGRRGSAARTGPAGTGSDAADSLFVGGGPPPGSIGIEEPHKNAAGTPLIPTSAAIIAENTKPGTAWWVTTPQRAGDIEGYADKVSAVLGETVRLFVSTKATSFRVQAYRMGYYQGIGARLVWESAEIPGVRQPPPALIAPTNTIECPWNPSITVTIDSSWPPGAYLLKLVGATSEQQFIPLCVRDDTSRAAVVIQHSVTTWQAYNRWGGYSLYYGNKNGALSYTHDPAGGTYADRARMVSFDRPYDHDWASGAADFVGNEFPAIFQAERLGLDVTYWTDVDLHARPQLLNSHRALVSMGHDEYWSQPMRDAAAQAVAAGVNLAFLGANACYRQIRLQPSPLGPDRVQVCYKSAAEDPMTHQNPALVTVNWPQAPVSRPEAEVIGSTYQDVQALADMVITDASSWLFSKTGLANGQHLPRAVQGEFDRYVPGGAGPTTVDVLAHSVVPNRGNNYSDVTWYTVPGGGGVFSSGNASWVGQLSDTSLIPPNVVPGPIPGVTAPLLAMMENLYTVIGSGPASLTHPSNGTWRSVYTPGSPSSAAPNITNSA
jgi:hypothetical protein